MTTPTLQPWQAARVRDAVRPHLGYLHRLRRRMEQVGFPANDKLLGLVARAEDAAQALFIELHYASCGHGVGRSATPGGEKGDTAGRAE